MKWSKVKAKRNSTNPKVNKGLLQKKEETSKVVQKMRAQISWCSKKFLLFFLVIPIIASAQSQTQFQIDFNQVQNGVKDSLQKVYYGNNVRCSGFLKVDLNTHTCTLKYVLGGDVVVNNYQIHLAKCENKTTRKYTLYCSYTSTSKNVKEYAIVSTKRNEVKISFKREGKVRIIRFSVRSDTKYKRI
jgi:hypothetical protein